MDYFYLGRDARANGKRIAKHQRFSFFAVASNSKTNGLHGQIKMLDIK